MPPTTSSRSRRGRPRIPKGYRWGDLTKREGEDLLTFYRALLLKLGTGGAGMVRDIFTDAQTSLRKPTNLKTLVAESRALTPAMPSAKTDAKRDPR